jgi:LacI family transcriptional regulator
MSKEELSSAAGAKRGKRVTLADVAARTHVSLATVSQVLNGHPSCWASAETRKRVLSAVEELGYRPNLSARALRSGETLTIGMIATALGLGSAHNRLAGAEEAAGKEGYALMLGCHPDTSESEDLRIRALMDRGVDGLLVYPSEHGPHAELRKLAESGFPLVTFDGAALLDFECDDICHDYAGVGRTQVQHLVETGRRRLCLITPSPSGRSNHLREQGALAAISAAGLPAPLILTLPQAAAGKSPDLAEMEGAIHDFLLARQGQFDALLGNDALAALAMRAALKLGLSVPGSAAVMGSGNSIIGEYNTLPISTVTTHDDIQGAEAFRLLLTRMKDRAARPPCQQIRKPGTLLPRASTLGGSLPVKVPQVDIA